MKYMKSIIMAHLFMATSSVFAMQAMNDIDLGQATGQDGVTISLTTPGVSARVIWHDNDGWSDRVIGANAGSVSFGEGTAATNFRLSGGTTVINVDADGGAGIAPVNGPMLNIEIDLPDDLDINTGNVYVSARNGSGVLTNSIRIMNDMKIELHGLKINVQLGSEAQGDMFNISGVVQSGIRIHNFALLDGSSSTLTDFNGIGSSLIVLKDSSGSDLTINKIGVNVALTGLKVEVADLNGGNGIDVQVHDLRLGDLSAASVKMGDAELRGLKLDGTMLTIRGH